METVKRMIWGPDPKEQMRKCQSLLRKNQRELDKHLTSLITLENKAKLGIKQSLKRDDSKSAKLLAKELYNLRKQRERLYKSKAQLASIGMQMNEAFAIKKIQGNIKSSSSIMRDINNVLKLSVLTSSMQEFSQELMKTGVINEMVQDTLDTIDDDIEEDDAEIDKILLELSSGTKIEDKINNKLSDKVNSNANTNDNVSLDSKLPAAPQNIQPDTISEKNKSENNLSNSSDMDDVLETMRSRLKELQS